MAQGRVPSTNSPTFPILGEHARAFVTGGASGIGLGTARRLAEVGADVVIADLPHRLVGMAAADRAGLAAVDIDVTDETAVRDAVAEAARLLGGIDIVVNSAGICLLKPLASLPLEEWERVLSVNLTGTFLVMRETLPHLRVSGSGRLVNIASNAGKRGYPMLGAYCAAKHGVVALTETAAVEEGRYGVRVNAVCPSTVSDTDMGRDVARQKVEAGLADSVEDLARRRASEFPLGRSGLVSDVVEAVLFLVSESSQWISGVSLNVDGGALSG